MLVENILSVFGRATPLDYVEGLTWYPRAHELAKEIAPTLEMGAGVIAALSPMMGWERNAFLARESFATGKAFGGLGKNVAKAQAIIDGSDPLIVLGGDKVTNFYQNILTAGNSGVTIDRHAYDIALNKVHGKEKRRIGKRVYREFSEAYVEAAKHIDILPAELQSITWLVWRKEIAK